MSDDDPLRMEIERLRAENQRLRAWIEQDEPDLTRLRTLLDLNSRLQAENAKLRAALDEK